MAGRRKQPTGPERLQPWVQYILAPALGGSLIMFETLTAGSRIVVFVTGLALLGVPASAAAQAWLKGKLEAGS